MWEKPTIFFFNYSHTCFCFTVKKFLNPFCFICTLGLLPCLKAKWQNIAGSKKIFILQALNFRKEKAVEIVVVKKAVAGSHQCTGMSLHQGLNTSLLCSTRLCRPLGKFLLLWYRKPRKLRYLWLDQPLPVR